MNKPINRNILWCEFFVELLYIYGVRNVSISPGSRNTPLTFAFANQKKIKKYVIVDERSSGFFALGLAKKSKSPVAVVTTSGTAAAELYPSIIEAYNQRIPLIICTADRPFYLRATGANQTINQENIYKNHIRGFFDPGLPIISRTSFKKLHDSVSRILAKGLEANRGPVHFNLPFEKPFEPSVFTDMVDSELLNFKPIKPSLKKNLHKTGFTEVNYAKNKIYSSKRILILIGPNNFSSRLNKLIIKLAENLNAALFTDGLSGLRLLKVGNNIWNCSALAKANNFIQKLDSNLIIQFGDAPTSSSCQNFFENSSSFKIIINEYGDLKDPSRTANKILKIEPEKFCRLLLKGMDKKKINADIKWLNSLIKLNARAEEIKRRVLENAGAFFEGNILSELFTFSEPANIMLSNSLTVRDVDSFLTPCNKNINIYFNRGASGIDGIISTAAGIASRSQKHSFLVIGDLAFHHDTNGLLVLRNNNIPLNIILLNNGGGAIFDLLPVADEKINFKKYFSTPTNLSFKKVAQAYDINYISADDGNDLSRILENLIHGTTNVIEVKINSKKSLAVRRRYWNSVTQMAEKSLNVDPGK